MSFVQTGDYFDKARSIAASVLFASGAAAIIGAVLDWVTVEERPPNVPADQLDRLPPLSGIEVEDGWYVIGAAAVIWVSAFFIVLRRRAIYSWLAFVASIVIGAIAVADYRDVDGLLSDVEGIGRGPEPGVGLLLVAAAAFVGMVAAVAGVAASPSRAGEQA
jgi:hypothetical protein